MQILTCILLTQWIDASSLVGLTCAHCLNTGWFACLHCSLESHSDFAVHCLISAVLQFKTVLVASCSYILLGGATVCRWRFDLRTTYHLVCTFFIPYATRFVLTHIYVRTSHIQYIPMYVGMYCCLPLLTLPSVKVVLHEIVHKWGCCLPAKGELLHWFCAGEVKGCRGAE